MAPAIVAHPVEGPLIMYPQGTLCDYLGRGDWCGHNQERAVHEFFYRKDVLLNLQGEWVNAQNDQETYVVVSRTVSRQIITRQNDRETKTFVNNLIWSHQNQTVLWGHAANFFLRAEDISHAADIVLEWTRPDGGKSIFWRRPAHLRVHLNAL